MEIDFKAKLWRWDARQADSWYFVTVPKKYWDEIHIMTAERTAGFGSVKVKVRLGVSTWETSIFPDKKTESYVLPIKKSVRKENNLEDDDIISINLQILIS